MWVGGGGGNVTGQEGFRGEESCRGAKGTATIRYIYLYENGFRASYSDDLQLTNSCLSLSLLCEIRACSVY